MDTTYRNMLSFWKKKREWVPPLVAYTSGAMVAIPVSPVLPGNSRTTVGVGELDLGFNVRNFRRSRWWSEGGPHWCGGGCFH